MTLSFSSWVVFRETLAKPFKKLQAVISLRRTSLKNGKQQRALLEARARSTRTNSIWRIFRLYLEFPVFEVQIFI